MSRTVVRLRLSANPDQAIIFRCISSHPTIMEDLRLFRAESSSVIETYIPSPGSLDEDTIVTYRCAPATLSNLIPPTEAMSFALLARPIKARIVRGASSGVTMYSASGVMIPFGSGLTPGNLDVTPVLSVTTVSAPGAIARILLSSAPSVTVAYACISSNASLLPNITNVSVSSTSADIPIPRSTDTISVATIVRYTCAPKISAAGLKTTDAISFDVQVNPRKVQVTSKIGAPSASGRLIRLGDDLSGGQADKTLTVYSGVSYASPLVQLDISVPATALVYYQCRSSLPSVIADIPAVMFNSTGGIVTRVLNIPSASAVPAETVVQFTCAPLSDAGGYTAASHSVRFDIAVTPVRMHVKLGSLATTNAIVAADGATRLREDDDVSGGQSLAKTLRIWEGQGASEMATLNGLLTLKLDATFTNFTSVRCASDTPSLMADLAALNFAAGAQVAAMNLPITQVRLPTPMPREWWDQTYAGGYCTKSD